MSRILVTGSRDLVAIEFKKRIIDLLSKCAVAAHWDITVVHGACPTGADAHVHEWAHFYRDFGVIEEAYPAKWELYGIKAGPIRNAYMVSLGADKVLAFPMGSSVGTRGCVKLARKAGLDVKVYEASVLVG